MKLNVGVPNSMKVAAMVQPWEGALNGADIGKLMAAADAFGFNKCMLGEHFIIPKEHVALSGDWYFHTVVALGYIGGQTRNLRLSSSVSILPLQNPIVQAKGWSTLDWLSGGRAEALFGVGWLKEEFDMLGVPFAKRGRMADEYVAAMIELWTKDDPEFEGEFVNFRNCGFAPKPVQKPGVPIWFGGDAQAVQQRVAKFGNGWSPFRTPPETFPDCIDFIKSQPEYDGRRLDFFFALEMLNVGAHHEILDDPRAPGTADKQKILDQIGWLKELGITETIVPLPPGITGEQAWLDRQQWVSEEIMPVV
ncbi:TIGR03619 family F420-dependent LLM class oxidoreductase [Novosphingobium sp.]|uniref:TIGR03619 family F420-dependent LLM class oxidoreductase n=1 Tax=Novosphingobium sp. TaxID=1874826 RepID=UPI00286DD20C|nr:TIGR03619 family F420-dependent LLM class oxidoreductase [Novosphingobium sp.]